MLLHFSQYQNPVALLFMLDRNEGEYLGGVQAFVVFELKGY
jgi:hypothetical protein